MNETVTKQLHLLGTRGRPKVITRGAPIIEGNRRLAPIEVGSEIPHNGEFIERNGSVHPAWVLGEFANLVQVLDDPAQAGNFNAPTHVELRFWAELIVAYQHVEHGPGVEEIGDFQAVPQNQIPEHRPHSRTYRRLDGKNVRAWNYKLIVQDLPDPKTGAPRTCKPDTWRVEYVGDAPAPLPPSGSLPLVARVPVSVEEHPKDELALSPLELALRRQSR